MSQKVLVFEPTKCIGCRLCEQWCSLTHHHVSNPAKSCIKIIRDHHIQIDFATYCHQCNKPACIDACKFEALTKDDETGAIIINEDNCIGCRACIRECPFAAPSMHPSKKIVLICDLCGGDPECVKHCPEEAIQYTDVERADNLYRTIFVKEMAEKMIKEAK
jgi:anaerobic carbon-monoxide dehydrogenase iron sulfur subunit